MKIRTTQPFLVFICRILVKSFANVALNLKLLRFSVLQIAITMLGFEPHVVPQCGMRTGELHVNIYT
jgi:hypothetical protein